MATIGTVKTDRERSTLNSLSNMDTLIIKLIRKALGGSNLQKSPKCSVYPCSEIGRRHSERRIIKQVCSKNQKVEAHN